MPTTRQATRNKEDSVANSSGAAAALKKPLTRRCSKPSKIRPSPLKVSARIKERIPSNHDDIEKGEEVSHHQILSGCSTTDSESTSSLRDGSQRKPSLRLRRGCADYSEPNTKPSITKTPSVSSPEVQGTSTRETSRTKTKQSLKPRRSLRNKSQTKDPTSADSSITRSTDRSTENSQSDTENVTNKDAESHSNSAYSKEEINSEANSNNKQITKESTKQTTESSSPSITKSIAPKSEKISTLLVKTSSFYSNKSKSTPRLKTWLQTARASDERPTTSSAEDSSSSKEINSKPYRTIMKESNTKTPISRIFKANLKHTQISTPIVPKNTEPEHLFGFENLLEPAASILQDVSPIGQIPLPSEVRKRKNNKVQKAEKLTASFLDSDYPDVPQKRNKPRKAKTKPSHDEDDGVELELFQVEPIMFEAPAKVDDIFEYKEAALPKLPKPVKGSAPVANNFDMDTALPWQDIMDHELIIESV